MFAAVDESLSRLYPDRRWGHRDEQVAFEGGLSAEEGQELAETIARKLGVATRFVPGGDDEWCDYIYVLCLGRVPSIVDIREDALAGRQDWSAEIEAAGHLGVFPSVDDDASDEDTNMDDRYLRIAVSAIVRFVGVQEVAMRLRRKADAVVITERVRSGVFDPILLPRFQALVALLSQTDIRHLDFGEIVEPPNEFDGGDYVEKFGTPPTVANYLFSPRPVTTEVTTVLDLAGVNSTSFGAAFRESSAI